MKVTLKSVAAGHVLPMGLWHSTFTQDVDAEFVRSAENQMRMDLTDLTREEAATIWFALEEYKKNLRNTLSSEAAGLEDEVFCYDALAKLSQLQFAIRDDHDNQYGRRDFLQLWLDV